METTRVEWSCSACCGSGPVLIPKGELMPQSIDRINADHQIVSPGCRGDVRVNLFPTEPAPGATGPAGE